VPDRALSFYARHFAVWVILFGVLAYRSPAPFAALKARMGLFFAFAMFGIGGREEFRVRREGDLTGEDFRAGIMK